MGSIAWEGPQTGYLYKALGGWHVRYWKTELKGAKPIRVQSVQVRIYG